MNIYMFVIILCTYIEIRGCHLKCTKIICNKKKDFFYFILELKVYLHLFLKYPGHLLW